MLVYTDKIQFAEQFLAEKIRWQIVSQSKLDENVRSLSSALLPPDTVYRGILDSNYLWQYIFFLEHAADSQFDVLVNLSRQGFELPHGVLCIAGSSKKFHGFQNRPWVSVNGNIHLSAFLKPQQRVAHFGVGFTILSAVSVLQALDSIDGLAKQSMVKWVNDILIGNAKVGGVLACTQTQGNKVTGAVLGIGLNVGTKPEVEPTPFVPEVAALREFVQNAALCNRSIVLRRLIRYMDQNYRILVTGHFDRLLEFYRDRSFIIGKKVSVFTDRPDGQSKEIISGRVESVGENLELIFEGVDTPVSRGRLALSLSS